MIDHSKKEKQKIDSGISAIQLKNGRRWGQSLQVFSIRKTFRMFIEEHLSRYQQKITCKIKLNKERKFQVTQVNSFKDIHKFSLGISL